MLRKKYKYVTSAKWTNIQKKISNLSRIPKLSNISNIPYVSNVVNTQNIMSLNTSNR